MEEKGLLWIVVVLAAILVIANIFMFGSIANNRDAIENQKVSVNVDFTDQNNKISNLETAVNDLKDEITAEENSTVRDYVLNKDEYEDELSEEKALELALDELDSKDFKKAVFEALEDEGVDIDSYKDITEIKVMDSDVQIRKFLERGIVDLDIKVYYFLDGDEDEEERARLEEFTIVVDDLDYDENFDDAEVDEDYLDSIVVKKVYE